MKKNNYYPEIIYHYCKLNTFLEFILPSKKLLLNSYRKTNDPHENKRMFSNSNNQNYITPSDTFKNTNFYLQNKINDIIESKIKVTCFTQTIFKGKYKSLGYQMPRMWANYGENFRGICIGINLNEMIKKNKDLFKSKFSKYRPVKYHFSLPKIDFERVTKDEEKCILNFIRRNLEKLFFYKHLDWKGENEFRIVTLENYNYIDISECVNGIYLGLETPEVYYRMICDNFKRVLKMKFDVYSREYYFEEILIPLG